MRRLFLVAIALFVVNTVPVHAEEYVIFEGHPVIKISEAGNDRVVEKLKEQDSQQYVCRITEVNGKYYWLTREDVELIPIESGAYVTFFAVNGAGYVKIIAPGMKEVVSVDPVEKEFDYIEHMTLGLKTITYYGVSN